MKNYGAVLSAARAFADSRGGQVKGDKKSDTVHVSFVDRSVRFTIKFRGQIEDGEEITLMSLTDLDNMMTEGMTSVVADKGRGAASSIAEKMEGMVGTWHGCVDACSRIKGRVALESRFVWFDTGKIGLSVIDRGLGNNQYIVFSASPVYVGRTIGYGLEWLLRDNATFDLHRIDFDDEDALVEKMRSCLDARKAVVQEAGTRRKMSSKAIARAYGAARGADKVIESSYISHVVMDGAMIDISVSGDMVDATVRAVRVGREQPFNVWFDLDDIDRVTSRLDALLEIWSGLRSQLDPFVEDAVEAAKPLMLVRDSWLGFATATRADFERASVFPAIQNLQIDGDVVWKSLGSDGLLHRFDSAADAVAYMMGELPTIKRNFPVLRESRAKSSMDVVEAFSSRRKPHQTTSHLNIAWMSFQVGRGMMTVSVEHDKHGSTNTFYVKASLSSMDRWDQDRSIAAYMDNDDTERLCDRIESLIDIWEHLDAEVEVEAEKFRRFISPHGFSLYKGWIWVKDVVEVYPLLVQSRIDGGVRWICSDADGGSETFDRLEDAMESARGLFTAFIDKPVVAESKPIPKAKRISVRLPEAVSEGRLSSAFADMFPMFRALFPSKGASDRRSIEQLHRALLKDYPMNGRARDAVRTITGEDHQDMREQMLLDHGEVLGALTSMSPAARDFVVYRGCSDMLASSSIEFSEVQSWSIDPIMASTFGDGMNVLALGVKKGTSIGAYIAGASTFPMEKEFMTRPGLSLSVVGEQKEIDVYGRKAKLWTAVVGQAPRPIAEAKISRSSLEQAAHIAAAEIGADTLRIHKEVFGLSITFFKGLEKVIMIAHAESGELSIGSRTPHVVTVATVASRNTADMGRLMASMFEEAVAITDIGRRAVGIVRGRMTSDSELFYMRHDGQFMLDFRIIARLESRSFAKTIRSVGGGPEMREIYAAEDVADFLMEIITDPIETQETAMEKSVKLLLAGD